MLKLATVAGLTAGAVALAREFGLAWLVLHRGGAGFTANSHRLSVPAILRLSC